MGCFGDVALDVTLDKLTYEENEIYLKSHIQNKDNIYDPTSLKEVLIGLKFSINIIDRSTRIKTYCADAFWCLDAMGYKGFKIENPNHTNKILLKSI